MWLFWPSSSAAQETTPTPAHVVETVVPLNIITPTTGEEPATATPTTPLEPVEIEKTATFVAAINRPAGNPQTAPLFVGVVTYEPGCTVSNLGFTTSGYEGEAFYLYFQQPLERDPLMQMLNLRGWVQEFEGCDHPVLMVEQVFWFDSQATPAPLATTAPATITGTATITITATRPWGSVAQLNTPTRSPIGPNFGPLPTPTITTTPTTAPTWTPYPTYTPRPLIPTPGKTRYPTYTPAPTWTPFPTWTPNPITPTPTETLTPTPTRTPRLSTLTGPVVPVSGCGLTNMAVRIPDGDIRLAINDPTLLPDGDPLAYSVTATGHPADICGYAGLVVSAAQWFEQPTPTATATATLTPTATATATLTPTATITATGVITP